MLLQLLDHARQVVRQPLGQRDGAGVVKQLPAVELGVQQHAGQGVEQAGLAHVGAVELEVGADRQAGVGRAAPAFSAGIRPACTSEVLPAPDGPSTSTIAQAACAWATTTCTSWSTLSLRPKKMDACCSSNASSPRNGEACSQLPLLTSSS